MAFVMFFSSCTTGSFSYLTALPLINVQELLVFEGESEIMISLKIYDV
jgi:hypothetical protein